MPCSLQSKKAGSSSATKPKGHLQGGDSKAHYRSDNFHIDDSRKSRPGSVYSRADSEGIYDRIKDPIYERVKPDKAFTESLDRHRFPVSRAEPQVPIYRSIGKRVVSRRASEGSGGGASNDLEQYDSYGSAGTLGHTYERSIGSRLSVEDSASSSRRDSISPASKDSYSSLDSGSTLTGNNSECTNDSMIISRIRKSFEQKEEFLRRPSHPIGWFMKEEGGHLVPVDGRQQCKMGIIPREFYARPQKLQKQMWPPGESQRSSNSPVRLIEEWSRAQKQAGTQYLGKIKEPDVHFGTRLPVVTVNNGIGNNTQNHCAVANGGSKAAFVSTLSRIHENVAQQQSAESKNGTSSLPSSPGLDKKPAEKFPVPPQLGLQIVSRRTKQFESGRLVSDDDEPIVGDRTSLYKSELSRLSNKRSVPNVAVRKREFESKAESQEPRKIVVNRESKSLEAGAFYLVDLIFFERNKRKEKFKIACGNFLD